MYHCAKRILISTFLPPKEKKKNLTETSSYWVIFAKYGFPLVKMKNLKLSYSN